MANLKQDLINNLGNEKYYDEIELVRLAQDTNISYKEKIERMAFILKNIQSLDFATQLVSKYFQEPQQTNAPMGTNNPSTQSQPVQSPKPQPGQTHAE